MICFSASAYFRLVAGAMIAVAAIAAPALAQFETRATSPLPEGTFSIATGDFNRDGKLDLGVMGGNGLSVAMGNGDGTFRQTVSFNGGGISVAAADFNNDGNLDLVATTGNNSVTVYLGNGDGTFQSPKTTTTTAYCSVIVVGDFNNDHKIDIVVIDFPYISVLLGNGDGTFQAPHDDSSFVGAQALAVGDLNNDHKLDVLAVGFFGADSNVGVLLGNGDGSLQPSLTYHVNPLAPESVVLSDFNHDGNLDVAAETQLGPVMVLLGKGDGSFQPEVDYAITGGYGRVAVADFNGDGALDLAVTSLSLPKPGVNELLGKGDGTFQPARFYPGGSDVGTLAVGDFNGDHKPDVVLADTIAGAISLLNTGIVAFSPTTPLSFSVQVINTKSAPQSVTLTNTGTTSLSIGSVQTSGNFHAGNNCKGEIIAGGSCKITATFQPKNLGSLTGLLLINDTASSKPQTVELLGQATALDLSPTALNFGSQKVGTKSPSQRITVTNESSIAITLTSRGVGGADSNDFGESDNCGSRLAAGAWCTLTVTFTPHKTGTRSGTAYVDVGQGAGPPFVPLSGTGTN